MYNVNTKRIDEVLTHMGAMIDLLATLSERTDEDLLADKVALAAIERGLHVAIESIIDVGNALIDGFIMRDPGSYTDIVDILLDEQVVGTDEAAVLTEVVEFRKKLVLEYTSVPKLEMLDLVRKSMSTCRQFAPLVRSYVEKELF